MRHARKIPARTMKEILWGDSDEGEVVLNEITGTGRWSIHHRLIFKMKNDGLLYEAEYSRGATEHQDQQPWDEEDEVEADPVEAVLVRRMEYRKVGDQ